MVRPTSPLSRASGRRVSRSATATSSSACGVERVGGERAASRRGRRRSTLRPDRRGRRGRRARRSSRALRSWWSLSLRRCSVMTVLEAQAEPEVRVSVSVPVRDAHGAGSARAPSAPKPASSTSSAIGSPRSEGQRELARELGQQVRVQRHPAFGGDIAAIRRNGVRQIP